MLEVQDRLPRLALAACIGLMFGGGNDAYAATTLTVSDCSDGSGFGTLRNSIAIAASGDTVQIPMACSRITLRTGELKVQQADLTISGLGATRLTIDGGSNATPPTYNSVFDHQGTGTLSLNDLTVTGGTYVGPASSGGCVFSKGSVYALNSVVTGCVLFPSGPTPQDSKGGGIYALGHVTLKGSTVSENVIFPDSGNSARGAGVYAKSGMVAKYSTLSGNHAVGGNGNGPPSRGGGAFVVGAGLTIIGYSTISENSADINSALQVANPGSSFFAVDIRNSTISGNKAGVFQTVGTYLPTSVKNSTIAFNAAAFGGAFKPAGFFSDQQINMQSSIFANNFNSDGTENDIYSSAPSSPLIGANNLIVATSQAGVPLGTLSACPKLGHLSKNGGRTLTIPLAADSPAIDAGNNAGSFTHDQRHTGFARVVGANADIGAYETHPTAAEDVIFFGQFEGRCD
jgi:hypothetical protein